MTMWYIPPELTKTATGDPAYPQAQATAQTPIYNPYAGLFDPYTNPTGSRGIAPTINRAPQQASIASAPGGSVYGAGSSVDSGLLAVLRAQKAELAASRAGLGLAEQQLATRRGELGQLQAAEGDIANLSEVGRGLTEQAAYDKRYGMAGLPLPFDILAPKGGEGEALPAGMRYKIESDAERLAREQAAAEAKRRQAAEAAALKVQKAGLNTQAAQIKKAQSAATSAGSTVVGGQTFSGSAGRFRLPSR